jgi:hypothetical protein
MSKATVLISVLEEYEADIFLLRVQSHSDKKGTSSREKKRGKIYTFFMDRQLLVFII